MALYPVFPSQTNINKYLNTKEINITVGSASTSTAMSDNLVVDSSTSSGYTAYIKDDETFDHNVGILSIITNTTWQGGRINDYYISDNRIKLYIDKTAITNAGAWKCSITILGYDDNDD